MEKMCAELLRRDASLNPEAAMSHIAGRMDQLNALLGAVALVLLLHTMLLQFVFEFELFLAFCGYLSGQGA